MKTAITKVGILASILGVAFAASPASAGLCQNLSSIFYTTMTCGLASRGNVQGTTVFGQKALRIVSTGDPWGPSSVGGRGVRSDGTQLAWCCGVDSVEDGSSDQAAAWSIGGECNQAVKFWIQVNY